MISVLFVDRMVILAATALMHSVMAVMTLTILPRTAPTKSLHQEHHATTEDLVQGIDTPTTGRAKSHSYGPRHRWHYSRSQSHPCLHCKLQQKPQLQKAHSTLLPATTAALAALQPMDAPTMIPTGIVTSHPNSSFLLQVPLTLLQGAVIPAAPAMQH